uniref:NADH dehydrogenase subunit 2 n=1 Tax=Rhodesiella elegantula TaxID=3027663 RepID=UPI0023D7D1F0|nr:NADH dehydrogenase subunit 2 [Rhodesiella elegantula]WDA93984.1 NADH dehydrogenase subunit 2 [Rhodesiella elegantula]
MFNNSSKIMFVLMLILGTMMTISANSWLSAWMGLEINLLSFIPLMSDNNLMSTEASLKYFLTQALASTILLFSVIMMTLILNYKTSLVMSTQIENISNLMIISSLLLKVGAAPFHFWFPNIIEGLSWFNSFILMTWQKIAPFMLMTYLINSNMIIICSILSVMFGSLGGLNQSLLRKLMAFSSINHLGWMMSSLLFNQSIWLIYFLFYSFLSFNLVYMFNLWKIFHINKMFSLFSYSKSIKFTMMFNLLSLGGLPPFMGFIPKWIVINLLTMNHQYFLTFVLISFTLIALFFYLRICYSGLMLNNFEPIWINSYQINDFQMNMYMFSSSISILGLPFISLLFIMF